MKILYFLFLGLLLAGSVIAQELGNKSIALVKPIANNIAKNAKTIIASVTNPEGGGSKDLEIIRDGIIPVKGTSGEVQYDTYVDQEVGGGQFTKQMQYFGYEFSDDYKFTKLVFTEGDHFGSDGGWFVKGTLKVQVKRGDKWFDVSYISTPVFNDSILNYSRYMFDFTAGKANGIRIIGLAGGNQAFTSISELEVVGRKVPVPVAGNIANNAFKIIASVTSPMGDGNPDIEIIRDGVIPIAGSLAGDQYDTYKNPAGPVSQFFGYEFTSEYDFTQVLFAEGKHFGDGGWFTSPIKVQVKQGSDWIDVLSAMTPAYEGHAVNFDQYTFTFSQVRGNGIRIISDVKLFATISELEVVGLEVITGLNSLKNISQLVVYPNPAVSFVQLKLDADFSEGMISIVDMTGKVVFKSIAASDLVTLDVSSFNSGIYFIRVQQGSKIRIGKLIVSK